MEESSDNFPKNEFVGELLTDWNFPMLIETFNDNKIDEEVFPTLSAEDFRELIPQLGLRKKFTIKYQQYLLETATDVSPIITTDESITTISNIDSSSSVSNTHSEELDNIGNDVLEKPCYSQKATLGVPYFVTQYTTTPGETVKPLLEKTEEGLIIKKSYGANSKFLRTNLCNLIIKNELEHSKDKKITSERFIQLANEINDIFIHEAQSIYYLPYCKSANGKIVAARGKLWSTYIHQRQLYKKAGLLLKSSLEYHPSKPCQPSTSSSENSETSADPEEINELLAWLKNNT